MALRSVLGQFAIASLIQKVSKSFLTLALLCTCFSPHSFAVEPPVEIKNPFQFVPDCVKRADPKYGNSGIAREADPQMILCCMGLAPLFGAVCAPGIVEKWLDKVVDLTVNFSKAACYEAVSKGCVKNSCDIEVLKQDLKDNGLPELLIDVTLEGCKTACKTAAQLLCNELSLRDRNLKLGQDWKEYVRKNIKWPKICDVGARAAGSFCRAVRTDIPICGAHCALGDPNHCTVCCLESCPREATGVPVSQRACMKRCERAAGAQNSSRMIVAPPSGVSAD